MLFHKVFSVFALSLLALCILLQLFPLRGASAQGTVEGDFIALLNAERGTQGKSPVTVNSHLTTAAYLHSQDMAEQNYFSHTSLDGRTFVQRIVAAGYTNYSSLAENIAYAYGAPDAARVFGMWKNSSGHYTNMIGDFNEAGLGVYTKNGYTYYTLDLGKSTIQVPEFPSGTILIAFFSLISAFALAAQRVGVKKRALRGVFEPTF